MKLAHKLILGAVVPAGLLWGVGFYATAVAQRSLRESIEQSSATRAVAIMDEIDRAIYHRISDWMSYTRSDTLMRRVLHASNLEFAQLEDAQSYIDEQDRLWRAAGPDTPTPLMARLLANELSRELGGMLATLEGEYGFPVFGEVFLTNRYGANAALSNRTTDYRQDDEPWWRLAKRDGLYVSDVAFDESAGMNSTDICLRIDDDQGNFAGTLKAVLNLEVVLSILEERSGDSARGAEHHLVLFTTERRIIHGSTNGSTGAAHLLDDAPGYFDDHQWNSGLPIQTFERHDAAMDAGYLSTFVRSRGFEHFKGLGWILLLEYHADDVLLPVTRLRTRILLLAGSIGLVVLVFGGMVAISLSRRIGRLSEAASAIGRGDLGTTVEVRGTDELAQLAGSFNRMAADLDASRQDLHDRQATLALRLRAIEAAQDMIVITDRDGVIEYVNPAFTRCTGYTAEEVVGRKPSVLKSGKHDLAHYQYLWETILSGRVWQGEITNRRKDGSLYLEEMSINPVLDDRGEVVRFVAIKRDITDRKRAEDALRESEARIRAILETAPNSIITISERGIVESVNPVTREMFGYGPDEIIGHNVSMLIPQPDSGEHDGHLRRYLETGRKKIIGVGREVVGLRKDGTTFPAHLSVSEIRVGDRRHFVGIVADITESKRAVEDRLRLMEVEHERNHLREAMDAQEQLLSVVGHELRTPLAALRATSELLLTEDMQDTQQRDVFLKAINDEVIRMTAMVNDLLEAARLKSGTARWTWDRVQLGETCRAAIESIAPLVNRSRVELECSVEPEELAMNGDPDAIRRLVLNLLNNSHKHTKDGSIRVTARAVDDGGEHRIELVVQDTGEGMSREIADRLGTPFALNAGIAGSSYVKGTGLGIAICKGIIAAHGGTMAVRSARGKGTTITMQLSAELDEPAAADADFDIRTEIAA